MQSEKEKRTSGKRLMQAYLDPTNNNPPSWDQIEKHFGYKVFGGPQGTQMPLLRAAGLVPASGAWIMQAFLDDKLPWNKPISKISLLLDDTLRQAFRKSLWSYSIDSSDVVMVHPHGKVKLARDSPDLYTISQPSIYDGKTPVLPDGAYERIDGIEIAKAQLDQHAGYQYTGWLSTKALLNNPVWRFLANEDKILLKEYASKMLSTLKGLYGTTGAMTIEICSPQIVPAMYRWRFHGTGFLRGGSIVVGMEESSVGCDHLLGLERKSIEDNL